MSTATKRSMKAELAMLVGAMVACAGLTPAAAGGDCGTNDLFELRIDLVRAIGIYGTQPQSHGSPSLTLDLSREKGVWWPGMAMALDYNQGFHRALVSSAAIDETNMTIEVLVKTGGDNWIKGNLGGYTIRLHRKPDGKFEGRYDGWFGLHPFAGVAYGEIKPPRPVKVPNYRPLGAREHPRILMRGYDLESVQAKLKTRFGRDSMAFFESQTNCLIDQAFLYYVTGRKEYADRAIPMLQRLMTKVGGSAKAVDAWHDRMNTVAIAGDFLWTALPPDVMGELDDYIDRLANAACTKLGVFGSGFNFNPASNWYAPVTGSAGTLGLMAIVPGPRPQRPLSLVGAGGGGTESVFEKVAERYRTDTEALVAQREKAWQELEWRTSVAIWQLTGGWDVQKLGLQRDTAYQVYKHLRIGQGDGGYHAEPGYAWWAQKNPIWAAAQYRTAFGRDLSPYPDATHHVVRRIMQQIYMPGGGSFSLDMDNATGASASYIVISFPIVPDEWKPGVLWVWNHTAGVNPDDESTAVRAVTCVKDDLRFHVQAFLSYPLEMKPRHPEEALPKTWVAKTYGVYLFRSGWRDANDFLVQVSAHACLNGNKAAYRAGRLNVFGLGHKWIGDADAPHMVSHAVLQLTERGGKGYGNGREAFFASEPDGSGALTIDMDAVYGRGVLLETAEEKVRKTADIQPSHKLLTARQLRDRIQEKERPLRRANLMDSNFIRMPDALDPTGDKGFRAVAVDYSGKSGAPCMLAIVDSVTSELGKQWILPIRADASFEFDDDQNLGSFTNKPLPQVANDPPPVVKRDARSFTVSYGNGSMRVTFLSPANPKISEVSRTADEGKHNRTVSGAAISVTGPTGKEGDFFALVTIQRGPPPPVVVEGEGLKACAKVGGRVVSYDGAKITVQ